MASNAIILSICVQAKNKSIRGKNSMDIAQILEAVMLVCFGCSWPMNLVKNYRAKSAKAMSLGFILLIITGYAAGIIAKICTVMNGGNVHWYVWVVYIFNICIVSCNLGVYFYNRKLDEKAEKAGK